MPKIERERERECDSKNALASSAGTQNLCSPPSLCFAAKLLRISRGPFYSANGEASLGAAASKHTTRRLKAPKRMQQRTTGQRNVEKEEKEEEATGQQLQQADNISRI